MKTFGHSSSQSVGVRFLVGSENLLTFRNLTGLTNNMERVKFYYFFAFLKKRDILAWPRTSSEMKMLCKVSKQIC